MEQNTITETDIDKSLQEAIIRNDIAIHALQIHKNELEEELKQLPTLPPPIA